ncbi:Nucleolar GTP-binding protein 1 [Malassezia vespertilionis]|uniref:Nucleolar GTP-binding protein 1 n=1 Tax=Malassezia vespertilionis TaxID=2020962 RepID=A0A2N1JFW0_9BASI|nr:Nucleolar GTP-binding protein 1 [Malassezia vespertilionis]PKI85440.1 Nog1p [Malassezia vespertilionis]WFD05400.1 Nucleolar GTP-binding protein 1 [Malassezia vespertilionis]
MSATLKASISPVPTANDFLDIVLSKTQRKTPTVIHPGFKITRIRSFYMRKIMFTKDAFVEKLQAILSEFPVLENLHPFTSSLMNVLYDKNHYKLALGQINTARHLIEQVAKDYVRLIKFGDSLFRCKQLKRAALGRMATIMRRNKDPLAYLEQVRQHISRLPSIDPSTRTLVICGYPNVGKSSFINKVTRADVDVQPYAFTTKSLFVGHMDYKYLRWQVIDTPGILDHPLEEMNTIEMQAITALAHLRSAILYFMDLSEQCGYTIEAQVQLFNSIKPLFANKPTFLVVNKIDVARLEDLDDERAQMVRSVLDESNGNVQLKEISTFTDQGIMDLKQTACETLLATRVEGKIRGPKGDAITNRLHVAVPQRRDDVERKPYVPAAIAEGTRKKYSLDDPARFRTEKDVQEEQGGAGVHNIDMKKCYILEKEDWKYDTIPEIYEGKNIADFVDPDILNSLDKLEREEEKLEADGFYDESDEELNEEERQVYSAAQTIKQRKQQAKLQAQNKKTLKARAQIPRTLQHRSLSQLSESMRASGIDPSNIERRAELLAKAKGLVGKRKSRMEDDEDVDMDENDDTMGDSMSVEEATPDETHRKKMRSTSSKGPATLTRGKSATTATTNKSGGHVSARAGAARIPASQRQFAGLHDDSQEKKARSLHSFGIRGRNMEARASESDRRIPETMPKWLFAGKRGKGSTRSR